MRAIPGVPDFNEARALGQQLFSPPPWPAGRGAGVGSRRGCCWSVAISARASCSPTSTSSPPDRYTPRDDLACTRDPAGPRHLERDHGRAEVRGEMAESNMLADRDEDFNTRYGSYRGWQMAIDRVKPIPRRPLRSIWPRWSLLPAGHDRAGGRLFPAASCACRSARPSARRLVDFLDGELGTGDIARADTYLEDPLRLLLHLMMSQPEYQLG